MKKTTQRPAKIPAEAIYKALNEYRVNHLHISVVDMADRIGVKKLTLLRTLKGLHKPRDYTHSIIVNYYRAHEGEILSALTN